MKVAVTGAAGFLGTNLLHQLVQRGHEVTAIDRTVPSGPDDPRIRWLTADVLDPTSMRAALDGVEVVYHLVAVITLAHRSDLAWRVNTEGVRVVAQAARAVGVRRMVHASSIHAFDQYSCGGRIDERSPRSVDPALPVYDRSKFQGEVELRRVIDRGLDAVICNPTGVYGPIDNSASRINASVWDAARGRVPVMVGGGFDLVDVRDVAAGLILASERGRTGENYLLPGAMVSMLELTRLAATVNGKRGPRFAIPVPVISAALPVIEPIAKLFGSDKVSRAAMGALLSAPQVDGAKARGELGYLPRPTERTVRDLVAFYRGEPLEPEVRSIA
ncbi:NAD-dependent epimerase/dehydratase family protein [Nocardia sp. CDC159]|uniref:NAD-dependent epimerase/dehydratase family protein n=1 Tax=Nocardia pulmonis TaxID=2951408 RepID=A0A9X2E8A0_9NOCA|nr:MULTISPECIES: NAD-dependent epimerase/dehydratase family protein [Nocardia]MCM6774720.1 NAD-dependent epimerase/dehydratase family protein [Nocardia pulmonis]MCM6787215.1 NAD-dependent epimerase/dehydratase family protein [Nocardia sp. CDC159]